MAYSAGGSADSTAGEGVALHGARAWSALLLALALVWFHGHP